MRDLLARLEARHQREKEALLQETYFSMLAMRRAAMYMKNRAIAAAWNSWIAMIDEMNRQRDAMYNSVKRWQNQLLFGAFNTWRVALAMGIHEKNTMLRAILRWGGSELLVSFEYWRETAMKIRVAELVFRAYLTKSYDQS